jgi:hypothetical protein
MVCLLMPKIVFLYLLYVSILLQTTAISLGSSSPRRENCSHDETKKPTPPRHNPFPKIEILG